MASNRPSSVADNDHSTKLPEKFQLPPLLSLEPLTKGTSLPIPRDESPDRSAPGDTQQKGSDMHGIGHSDDSTPGDHLDPTSPTSPRPGSVRRFLSKMSLSGSYKDTDAASITSSKAPMSPVSTIGMTSIDAQKSNVPKRTFSKSEKGFFGFRRNSSKRTVSADQTSTQAAKRVALEEQTAKALEKDPAPSLPDLPTLNVSLDADMFRKI